MNKQKPNITKKFILAAVTAIAIILTAAIVYIFVLLNRVSHVSTTTKPTTDPQMVEEIVKTQKPKYTQNTTSPDYENKDILSKNEIDLKKEIAQTKLTDEEKLTLEMQNKSIINVLLLGVDRRGSKGESRSDTIIIATIDKANKRIKLTSIMRDLYVKIPGYGENRINAACSYGGADLVMKSVNENFFQFSGPTNEKSVSGIDKYIMVDFKMFEKLVDSLGGVTIEMSRGEVSEANDCIAGFNKQRKAPLTSGFIKQRGGIIKLSGKQALGYARMRHFGNGDFDRTTRQFKILQEIFKKFLDQNPLKQNEILMNILPFVETNLSTPEILQLSIQTLSVGNFDLLHYRVPVDGLYKAKKVRGMFVFLADIPATALKLNTFLTQATQNDDTIDGDTKKGRYQPKIVETPPPTLAPEIPEVLEIIPNPTSENPENSQQNDNVTPETSTNEENEIIVG